MSTPLAFRCTLKCRLVEGMEPSKVIDALLEDAEIAGEKRPKYPDVHGDSVKADDRGDGQLAVEFLLDPGFPRTTEVVGAGTRAATILNLVSERLVGISPPIDYMEVIAE